MVITQQASLGTYSLYRIKHPCFMYAQPRPWPRWQNATALIRDTNSHQTESNQTKTRRLDKSPHHQNSSTVPYSHQDEFIQQTSEVCVRHLHSLTSAISRRCHRRQRSRNQVKLVRRHRTKPHPSPRRAPSPPGPSSTVSRPAPGGQDLQRGIKKTSFHDAKRGGET